MMEEGKKKNARNIEKYKERLLIKKSWELSNVADYSDYSASSVAETFPICNMQYEVNLMTLKCEFLIFS